MTRANPITMAQIEFACKLVRRPIKINDRDWNIFVRHVRGESQKDLANEHSVSQKRIRDICMKIGRIIKKNQMPYLPNSNIYLRPTNDLKRRLNEANWTRSELEYEIIDERREGVM